MSDDTDRPLSPARAREALQANEAWHVAYKKHSGDFVMRDVSAELTRREIDDVWDWIFAQPKPGKWTFSSAVEACADER